MINDLSKLIKNKYLYGSLIYSLEQFFINDDLLLSGKNDENSVYEVAISCKIGTYIYSALLDSGFFKDEQYKEFNIDMEYNKMGMKKIDKEIPGIGKLCGNSTNKIRPDIVIHKRLLGGSNNNLVIFEIKKKNLNSCDRKKLEELTKSSNEKFGYQYGIGLSNFNKKNESVDIDLCINGKFYEKGFIYKALEITYK